MENVSKALLIAAAVLIAIILITFGIKIYNSSKGTAQEGQKVGDQISSTVGGQAESLISQMSESWKQNGRYITNGSRTIEVGTKVNYTAKGNSNWAVLGAENGQLLIVATEDVGKLTLSGSKGYNNGVTELDEECKKYINDECATNARSIRIEDIDKLTGYNKTTYGSGFGKYGNTVTYTLKNGEVTYLLEDGKSGTGIDNIFRMPDGRNLKEGESISLTSTYYSYNFSTNNISFLASGSTNYWLASTYVSTSTSQAEFGLQRVSSSYIYDYPLYRTYGSGGSCTCGVRPVIYLKPNFKI